MRDMCLRWLFVLAFLAVLSPADAIGKITVDPYAGGQAIASTEPGERNDDRLAKIVTYKARHRALKTILADLSGMTGVTLKAGFNNQDWQVRDRKMNIFVRDIPLGQLLSSIARVMKFKWIIRREAGVCTYRLYLDRRTLLGADAELFRAQEAFDKEVTRRRQDFTKMIENWDDNLSPAELEKLRQDNPYLYLLHARGGGKALQGLFKDIPGLADSFINRERNMFVPVSSLSAETQQYVLNAAKLKFQLKGYHGQTGAPLPSEVEQAFGTGTVGFELVPREMSWDAVQYWDLAGTGLTINGRSFHVVNWADPSSKTAQGRADTELQAHEKDVSVRDVIQQKGPEDALLAEDAKSFGDLLIQPETVVEHLDEPALHKKIKVEADGNKLIDYECALAKASDLAVVSDSFNVSPGAANVNKQDIELKEVLTRLSDGYRYDWDKHGPIIEFRSKDWFKKRTTQIPDEWVDQWRAHFKASGYLCIDDFAQIAALTNAQIEENLKPDELFGATIGFGWAFQAGRPILRLYNSLNPTQRKAMFSNTGLSSESFGTDQWELLSGLLRKIPSASGNADALLKGEMAIDSKKNASCNVQLVSTGNSAELAKWLISLPGYIEPVKPQPKAPSGKETGALPQPTSGSVPAHGVK